MPSFVSVESRPYARSLAATLSRSVAESSFWGEGLDAGADGVVVVSWALLAFLGAEADMPSGSLGVVWMDG